jgi:hypothetical protein
MNVYEIIKLSGRGKYILKSRILYVSQVIPGMKGKNENSQKLVRLLVIKEYTI